MSGSARWEKGKTMEWIVEAECKQDLVDGYGLIGEELVRCKECKWRHSTFVCPVSYENRLDENYCCFGERKDDDN